jgi:outer membrane protein assembly factor BamB
LSRLAPSAAGVVAVSERGLVVYDATGARVDEYGLDAQARSVARFGDDYLVRLEKQRHLVHVADGVPAPFAAGKGTITAFGVGRDDAVAVGRGESVELWSRDGVRAWATKGGPCARTVVARDHVVALGVDGALVFHSREGGAALGALRLASPEPPTTWRLAHVDGNVVVLALGEWLVWIDASTRKTVRRVRARAKVLDIAADRDHVTVAVEGGCVQAFRAATGEPRASFSSDDGELCAIALGAEALFTMSAETAAVRSHDRKALEVTVRTASPITAIAVRGNVAAVGDRSGRVRVLEPSGGGLREIACVAAAEGTLGLHIAKDGTIVAGGARILTRSAPPWNAPRLMPLKGVPTAFVADDAYAFAGTQTGEVDVYDLSSGEHVTSYVLSKQDRITALARLSGALLAVGTGALDGRVLFVDVAKAKVVHRVSPHDDAFGVTCLASDARGRIVASGGDDGFVALLDPAKGRVLARLRVNETPTSIAFEPSGRRLACVLGDGTASVVTFTRNGATVLDLGVRGASHVAWSDTLVFGFKDGHAESGDRHVRPSERPAARN